MYEGKRKELTSVRLVLQTGITDILILSTRRRFISRV